MIFNDRNFFDEMISNEKITKKTFLDLFGLKELGLSHWTVELEIKPSKEELEKAVPGRLIYPYLLSVSITSYTPGKFKKHLIFSFNNSGPHLTSHFNPSCHFRNLVPLKEKMAKICRSSQTSEFEKILVSNFRKSQRDLKIKQALYEK